MNNQEKMKKLMEAMDFAGEPQQKPGDQVGGVEKPKSKKGFLGKPYKRGEHPFQDRLVGEDDESAEVDESPETERNQALAKARIPDHSDHEQRGVWHQHYERAKRNGRDDRAARRYADTMTSSESKFQTEDDVEEDYNSQERSAGDMAEPDDEQKNGQDPRSLDFTSKQFEGVAALVERLTKAYEDYVSNEKYSDDKIYPKKNQKPSVDKKKVKAPKEVDPSRVDEEIEKCPECHGSGQSREQGGRCQACDGSGNAPMQKKKKEKPFKDAAATGNPRDFANEATGHAKKGRMVVPPGKPKIADLDKYMSDRLAELEAEIERDRKAKEAEKIGKKNK